jgi:hypothetical protein
MRLLNLTALFSLVLAAALLYSTASWKDAAPATRSVQWLDSVDVELFRMELLHRHDVMIRVNNMEVARGYSRAGCDGLLLVAQLPNSAQGWRYIAPTIDLSNSTVRYVYKGNIYRTAPVLQKLRGWLVGTLPGHFESRAMTVGLVEFGHCHLIERAAPLLAATQSAVGFGVAEP